MRHLFCFASILHLSQLDEDSVPIIEQVDLYETAADKVMIDLCRDHDNKIEMVSSTVGSGIITGWKRRSRAASFSMY